MAKSRKRLKKMRKDPQKGKHPLTMYKKVSEANKGLADQFNDSIKNLSKATFDTLRGIRGAVDGLWKNQQLLNSGLSSAEAHYMIHRRVFNDALSGVTRVKTIERRVEAGKEAMEEVQLIDWDWYAVQLDYCDDPVEFMAGTLTPDEVIERKTEERRAEVERRKKEFEDAPTQEDMLAEADKLKEKIRRVTEEAIKREKGEPYDEELLAEADAEIAEDEKEHPFPEGASLFGGS